jgi:quinol---cytochrome c reductase iron-sulfur subunit, bacillus type
VELPSHDQQLSPARGARRSFLGVLLGVASAFVGALLGVPVLRYIFYPLTAKSDDSLWTDAGPAGEASSGQAPLRRVLDLKQRDGWRETASQPVIYMIKTGDKVKVLSAICPHLGCTVGWDAGRNAFVCPCHGGVFSPDGTYVSGPPPRGLDALDTKVSGGTLMVKYQYFRPDVASKQVTG